MQIKNYIFNGFLTFCLIICKNTNAIYSPLLQPQRIITIMLDPAGDAQSPGRKLDDNFERGITLQFAEKLKEKLQEHYPTIRIVLTRFPGETVQPLQNANFANRLDVDFYLNINFYHESQAKPILYLYNFSYGDDFLTKKTQDSFCSYDQAHLFNYETTKKYGTLMYQVLTSDSYKNQFECKELQKLPFKPLIGIKAPAIAFEAGIKTKDDFVIFLEPIAQSLKQIIEHMSTHQS